MNVDRLRSVKAMLLDLDGTLYLGDRLFEGTPGFLAVLRERGIRPLYMTNNCTRTAAQYVRKLRRLGIEATPDQVITSGQSAAAYLAAHPEIRRVFVLGTEALADDVRSAGKEVAGPADDESAPDAGPTPDADTLLVGFPTNLTYGSLSSAAFALQRGARFLATHPDPACPDPRGMLPDCASVCSCLETATGRRVEEVFGKPSEWMLRLALERSGVPPGEMALVGDRLTTDIRMGIEHGIPSVLVLSGATSCADLAASPIRPDLVFEDVGGLGAALSAL